MRVTNDDHHLITAGADGTLILYEIKDKEARGMKLREGFSSFADEVLVTREEMV